MKFMVFTMYNVAKAAEVAQAADKVANTPGTKILAQYACLGKPFDGVPPNNVVAITVREAESAEAYTITVDSIVDGDKTHEVLRARRTGDCAK